MSVIILTGFMGSGKTTVGEELTRQLSGRMADTDALLEAEEGMTVSRIFQEKGEEYFRERETSLLRRILERDKVRQDGRQGHLILSTGGGLPLKAENRRLLSSAGTVIYLRLRPESVVKRLQGDTTRPLLQGDNVRERVESLMESRQKAYLEADIVVDVDELTPAQIAERIREVMSI